MADPQPTAPAGTPSELDDFVDAPMGPGVSGKAGVGQSVHPQADPDTSAPAPRSSPPPSSAASSTLDPTKAAPGEKLGSEIAAARIGLGDGVLRAPEEGATGDVGGADGGGLGASLGLRDPTPKSIAPAADPEGAGNEQADARLDQARAQGGHPERSAPDQTRAEGDAGSINNTDGL